MTAPANIHELLPLYAINALAADEAADVERAVQADPALAAELDSYLALIAPVEPSPDVKARLLASAGGGRFDRFADRMAKIFDVTVDRARELLGLVERAASWETPMPGISLIHFDGGPACATADCGFVRIQPGCTFPWHTHRGEEINVILTGTLRDSTGKVLQAGDELVQQASTQHDLTAGDEEVIYVARATDGIEVSGPRS
ncbi:MAG TPA: cupin domain-containing protein [Kofleriaceae bacterium]|nr:cupin domain-containing protein [Kofleriaceae bacterium]